MKTRNKTSLISLFSAALTLLPGVVRAQATPVAPKNLPVRSVTLFSSGVSFTLRDGEVEGDALVPLTFRTAQINDILKSLVLLDDKGTVQPVVYGAKDPISRTLQSFAVDVTQPLSRAELLNRLRGRAVAVKMVEVTANSRVEMELIGQIIGVEQKAITIENKVVVIELLSLLTEEGLQWVRLDEVTSIRFTDDRINKEFREALALLASGADDRKRQVTLHFSGNSKRRVRVGYVSEAPLWKISYRLMITDSTEKPYMQGWALVENTTEDDWINVRLSLVSGQPISFIQDLYQPLYLPRPVVPLDIVASPYPQIAEGAIFGNGVAPPLAVAPGQPDRSDFAAAPKKAARSGVAGPGGFGGGGRAAGLADANAPAEALVDAESAAAGVVAQATGERAGELFQYNVTTPVTLPRQQAAMIPVIAQNIDGQKVSIYNADTGPKYPLNAFRVKNNTSLHLKSGAVTIFDGGIYAGDARMEDIPPGDSRLITYAVDLAVEGERQGGKTSSQETALSIKSGALLISRKERYETKYTLKNKADKPRTVLVEHPYNSEFTLVSPKQVTERTPNLYRFEVVVPPLKSGSLAVVLERPISEGIALIDGDISVLEYHVSRREVPEKIKVILREIVTRRRKIYDIQAQMATTEAEIKNIEQDQDRVRKNMVSLDRASALYKRYVQQLDDQETRIQNLRQEVTRLRTALATANKDLKTYIDEVDI